MFAPKVSSCIPNFVIFGFFDGWESFLFLHLMLAVWRVRTHLSCWKKWRWQLLCALASTVAWRVWPRPSWNKGKDSISALSSENSQILEKLCHVKGRRVVWWNFAGVATSGYADELQLCGFHSSFGISEKKHPKVSKNHMAFAASIAELISAPGWRWWCMVPHATGVHFGRTDVAWGLKVSMGVRDVSSTDLGMWSIETCCYRLRLRLPERMFLRWVLLVGLAFSDCHLMKVSDVQGGANPTWWKLLAVFRSFPSLFHWISSIHYITC